LGVKKEDKMNKKQLFNVWWFFGLVYILSALLYTPILLSGKGLSNLLNTILMVFISCLPSTLGIIFVHRTKKPEERRDFWRRVVRWPREHTKVAVVALALLPALVFISFFCAVFINNVPLSFLYGLDVLTNWETLFVFLFVEFFFGALSEELGWRGYALDELQSRWSAFTSSIVLGIVWALWHTPAFLIPGLSQHNMGGIFSSTYVLFIISVTIGSILHTWAYNNSGRSILIAGILMHFTHNASLIFLGGIFDRFEIPPSYWSVILITTLLAATALLIRCGPKSLICNPTPQKEISHNPNPAA
jgi:membrane protease YdiL (CAAX protease family)